MGPKISSKDSVYFVSGSDLELLDSFCSWRHRLPSARLVHSPAPAICWLRFADHPDCRLPTAGAASRAEKKEEVIDRQLPFRDVRQMPQASSARLPLGKT